MRPAASDAVADALATAGDRFAAAAEAAASDLSTWSPAETADNVTLLVAGPRAEGACEAAGALLRPVSALPVVVADEGQLPGHVDKGALVAVAALGPLERRRAAALAGEASARGADVLVVGEAGRVARAEPTPHGSVATASPAATAGLLDVLPALLVLGEETGVAPRGIAADAAAALTTAAASFGGGQPALHDRLARRIGRAVPLFEGARGIGAVAARSWRRSWNLLAKAPAIATAQPGAAFAEIAGFGQHGDVTRQLLLLVSLRTAVDPSEDVFRSRLFAELAGEALAGELEVAAAGDGAVAALVHLEWLGMATAHARALQEGLDPDALPVPGDVEARLAAEGGDGG